MTFPITNEAFQESPLTSAAAKRMLMYANRILANESVCDAYGHISVRNPEAPNTFFISRALPAACVTESDIMVMDLDGRIVTEVEGWRPFGEVMIHCACLRARPDISCVCHTHPLELIPFSAIDTPMRSIYHQDVTFYEGIPVFSDMPEDCGLLINNMPLANRMAAALSDKRGLLIRNHGVVVVGESVPRAVYSTITLRDSARILLSAAPFVEKLHYIDRDAAMRGTGLQFSSQNLKKAWDYWCARAWVAYPDIPCYEEYGQNSEQIGR